MPCYYVEGAVILFTLEELATKLVDYFPGLFLNFIFRHWVEEVTSICKTVCAKRSCFKLAHKVSG